MGDQFDNFHRTSLNHLSRIFWDTFLNLPCAFFIYCHILLNFICLILSFFIQCTYYLDAKMASIWETNLTISTGHLWITFPKSFGILSKISHVHPSEASNWSITIKSNMSCFFPKIYFLLLQVFPTKGLASSHQFTQKCVIY